MQAATLQETKLLYNYHISTFVLVIFISFNVYITFLEVFSIIISMCYFCRDLPYCVLII